MCLCRRSEFFSGLGITSTLESSAQVWALLPARSAGRVLDVFAQRKVLEAAAEAAVTVHGGQRVLTPVAMATSRAIAEVSEEERDSELRGPGAVFAPRVAERPRRRCG